MRELLFLGPFDVCLETLIVVVMMIVREILQVVSMVDLLSLREPGTGGFSPSVIEIKELVV